MPSLAAPTSAPLPNEPNELRTSERAENCAVTETLGKKAMMAWSTLAAAARSSACFTRTDALFLAAAFAI